MNDIRSQILSKLEAGEAVAITYQKAPDAEPKVYVLTTADAPNYNAKTDRVKVEVPDHLVNGFDLAATRWVSLKVENIIAFS